MGKQQDLAGGMLTWVEYWRLGDKAVLDVPDSMPDFVLPPGIYMIEISCICEAYAMVLVLQPVEYERTYVRMRFPGMEGEARKDCPRMRRMVCEKGIHKPPERPLATERYSDPSTWMDGINHDTSKHGAGTRKLTWTKKPEGV